MNIDIFTRLAPNSAPYADALQKNLTTLRSWKHNLRFWAMVAKRDIDTVGLPKHWGIIPVNTDNVSPMSVSKPSVNHAKLLNQIEYHISDDSDVTIITDCDMFVFAHNWDDFIYRKTSELDCIGTEKHDGSLRMFFIAFPTFVYRTLQPDWMPGIDKRYESGWVMDQIRHEKTVTDTGWALESLLIRNEKKYHKLSLLDGDYYYFNQEFCSHLGGSHKKDFKSAEVRAWYANCKNQIY